MSHFSRLFYKNSSFNPFVIIVTLALLALLVSVTIFLPSETQSILTHVKLGIFSHFSWFYVLSFSIFIFFLLLLSLSSFGEIRLGSDEEEPEFSFTSWIAMLFAAGMGVGLMFFGVAEPLSHFSSSVTTGGLEIQEKKAILFTLFHWAIHAWGVYAAIALALAYFGFRYKLPLALRSCFYPILKNKINGKIGDLIDIVALIATLFGIITTLGFGAAQLGAGLEYMNIIPTNSFTAQVAIIITVMLIAVTSACSGVGKGVKILSEINLCLALSLLAFVLVTGPTLYLLSAFSANLGAYLTNVIDLSFKTYVYDTIHNELFTDWTILYWAWWCSWAPFVGLFIARISRGRTIREFTLGVLALPSLFCIIWFTVFGNTAIWLDLNVANGALASMVETPERLLFEFFTYLPLPLVTGSITLLVISLFFVTSADSGIYVLNNIASRDKSLDSPKWQAIMWGIVMVIIAIVLLGAGGLATLQTMTLIASLPFALMMLIMCVSLLKGITADRKYFDTKVKRTSTAWTGENWRDRLDKVLNQTQEKDILKFLKYTALPAMRELKLELINVHNLNVEIKEHLTNDDEDNFVEIIIKKDSMRDFMYGIKSVSHEVSDELINDDNIPHIQHSVTYIPRTYFFDGRVGYDVQYLSRAGLVADILKHYERYLRLLDNVGQELMAHEEAELAE